MQRAAAGEGLPESQTRYAHLGTKRASRCTNGKDCREEVGSHSYAQGRQGIPGDHRGTFLWAAKTLDGVNLNNEHKNNMKSIITQIEWSTSPSFSYQVPRKPKQIGRTNQRNRRKSAADLGRGGGGGDRQVGLADRQSGRRRLKRAVHQLLSRIDPFFLSPGRGGGAAMKAE